MRYFKNFMIIFILLSYSCLFVGCKISENTSKLTATASILAGIGCFLGGIADFLHVIQEDAMPDFVRKILESIFGDYEKTQILDEPEMYIPEGAKKYNGHSYYVFDGVADSWQEAKKYCENFGGYLAIISDEKENVAVHSIMREQGFKSAYFGLTDEAKYNVWRWVDGSIATFKNWHKGEPNHTPSTERYGMFYNHYGLKWNDGCFGYGTPNGGKAFICEWDR